MFFDTYRQCDGLIIAFNTYYNMNMFYLNVKTRQANNGAEQIRSFFLLKHQDKINYKIKQIDLCGYCK